MYELGGFLGILTATFLGLALLNYISKWINKHWVSKLPKTSKFKAAYIKVMKFVVKKHRWFGLGAAVSMVAHMILQITFAWVSTTGLIAAALLIINGMIGAWMHYKQKGKRGPLLMVHRAMGVLLIAAIAVHVITKI
jgi:hypothetical protein